MESPKTTETLASPGLDPMLPRPFVLKSIEQENVDTWTLELEAVDADGDLAFEPGQFNMVYRLGVGEVPISISSDPTRPERLLHTIRSVGAVTGGLCAMKPGEILGLRGPFGNAWPVSLAHDSDLVFVAGGIGLAPLRPAIYQVLSERRRYGRVVILYGARSAGDMIFAEELETWRGRFDLDVQVTVDHATGDWFGHVGVVTTLIPRAGFDPTHTVAMVCGPEVMMRFTVRSLVDRGVASEGIYLSMERNMKCAVGFCGHCQFGPSFICKDGPVFSLPRVERWLDTREV